MLSSAAFLQPNREPLMADETAMIIRGYGSSDISSDNVRSIMGTQESQMYKGENKKVIFYKKGACIKQIR